MKLKHQNFQRLLTILSYLPDTVMLLNHPRFAMKFIIIIKSVLFFFSPICSTVLQLLERQNYVPGTMIGSRLNRVIIQVNSKDIFDKYTGNSEKNADRVS